jgi:hypothetical protein
VPGAKQRRGGVRADVAGSTCNQDPHHRKHAGRAGSPASGKSPNCGISGNTQRARAHLCGASLFQVLLDSALAIEGERMERAQSRLRTVLPEFDV